MRIQWLVPTLISTSVATLAYGSPVLGLHFDTVENDLTQGEITYRCYIDLHAGARIESVFGNSQSPLTIKPRSGRSFYQNPYGGPTSQYINPAFLPLIPSLEWDSFVTIGSLNILGSPFPENNLTDIGISWASFEAGSDLDVDNGSWFIGPNDAQGQELNGSVLIGQFTVINGTGHAWSDLEINVSLQGTDLNGDAWQILGLTWVPAPSAVAIFGLLAIQPRRRRN